MRALFLLLAAVLLSAGTAYSAALGAGRVLRLGGGSAAVPTAPCRIDRSEVLTVSSGGVTYVGAVGVRVRCDASGSVRLFYALSTDYGSRSGDGEVAVAAGVDASAVFPVDPSLRLGESYTLVWDLGPAR